MLLPERSPPTSGGKSQVFRVCVQHYFCETITFNFQVVHASSYRVFYHNHTIIGCGICAANQTEDQFDISMH